MYHYIMPYYFHLKILEKFGKNFVAISFTPFLVNIKIIFQIIYDLKQAYSCGRVLKLYVYLKLLSTAFFKKKSENFSLRILLKKNDSLRWHNCVKPHTAAYKQ